jgi:hypothetical protein
MSTRGKVRDEAIGVGIFVVVVVFALVADWWKSHQILGWTVLTIIIAGILYAFIKSRTLRQASLEKLKATTIKIVYEEKASDREPLPSSIRHEVYRRCQNRCENEACQYHGGLHIHHIDMNNCNNRLFNLIALCPNCHTLAHQGGFTETQLHNWMSRDYHRLQNRRYQ